MAAPAFISLYIRAPIQCILSRVASLTLSLEEMDIKVVDFDGIRTAADITPAVIDQLHEAFTTIGFVIITNHGVEDKVRVIV